MQFSRENRRGVLVERFHTVPSHIPAGAPAEISDEEGGFLCLSFNNCAIYAWVPKRCVKEEVANAA